MLGHQRRRLRQRQRRPSLRESDAALQFPPDALDLRHPERRSPTTSAGWSRTSGTAGRSGRRCSRCSWPGVLVCWHAEAGGNPDSPVARGGRGRRQHGRQGSALWHLQFRAVRHHHHRCLLRRGQRDARLLHAAGRAGAALQHRDRRSDLRRRRRRPLRHADLRRPRGVHRRAHGRPHAGIPGQEDRGLRRQAGDARPDGPRRHGPRLRRLGLRDRLGPGGPQQRRAARVQRNALRLQLGGRQQRQRLRRPHGQSGRRQSPLGHHPRASRCSSGAS